VGREGGGSPKGGRKRGREKGSSVQGFASTSRKHNLFWLLRTRGGRGREKKCFPKKGKEGRRGGEGERSWVGCVSIVLFFFFFVRKKRKKVAFNRKKKRRKEGNLRAGRAPRSPLLRRSSLTRERGEGEKEKRCREVRGALCLCAPSLKKGRGKNRPKRKKKKNWREKFDPR